MNLPIPRALKRSFSPVEAYLHMLAAVGEDLLQAVTSDGQGDLFDLRDPTYIAQTLPALRVMSKAYFRADVTGLENIPAEAPSCSSATTPAARGSRIRSSLPRSSTTSSA